MTFRALLPPLLAIFAAFLPACGDAGAADEGAGSSAGSGSKNTPTGSNTDSPLPNVSGAAGSGSSNGTTSGSTILGTVPAATWNSARPSVITEALLQSEYAAWKNAHVEACSNGSFVVVKDGSVVSEGIAYGMLLSVAMTDQPLFDGLWKYYQDHLDKNGLMNARTAKCEAPSNNNVNAATNADLDATMALIQAA